MTQFASRDSILGDFADVTLTLLGREYRLSQSGDDSWVEMEDPEGERAARRGQVLTALAASHRVKKRIGLLTGSHHMQVYWIPSAYGNGQTVFPFAWLIGDRRWVPFHQTFLRDPAIPPQGATWNLNCIECHATAGQPRLDPKTHLLNTRTGEMGIACEACHGPGEDHVSANQNPQRRYALRRQNLDDPTIVNPAKLAPHVASQVCGQCHGIKWIAEDWKRNGFSYRPGRELAPLTPIIQPTKLSEQPWLKQPLRQQPSYLDDHYWSDGMVRVSGREYNGLIESPCYQRGKLSCLSCHSLHQSQPDDQLASEREGNGACLQCHESFSKRTPAHTHHAAESSGSLCYNCHMPHTTYGLLKGIRSHQIDSPTVKASVQTGRPNACNLCHLDKTLEWTGRYLHEWFGQTPPELNEDQRSISAIALWLLQGDAGQRALAAFALGWDAAQNASGKSWLAPLLAQTLDDSYSAVRYIGHRSLRNLPPGFADFPYDFAGPEPQRASAPARALAQWLASAARQMPRPAGPSILLGSDGSVPTNVIQRLKATRNNRSLDLQE